MIVSFSLQSGVALCLPPHSKGHSPCCGQFMPRDRR